jgi:fatty acid desaturase
LAKSRRLNQFVGTFLSGYLIFQEFNTYRDSHVKRHHAFLGDPNKDPDYQYHLKENLYEYSNGVNFVKQFIVKPLLLSKTMSYFWYLVRYRLIPSRRYLKNFIEIFLLWGAIITFCYYFHLLTYLLLLWFVPLVTTAVVFGWFNELAEHYPLIKFNDNDLYMTRNRFSHWFEHFLFNTHNENYHLVHHLQASIPYWNLKKAHAVMCQDPNYASFNQSMGGIFISNNHNPSLIKLFLMGPMTFASKQEAIS